MERWFGASAYKRMLSSAFDADCQGTEARSQAVLAHADISTKWVEVLTCLAVGWSTIRIGSGDKGASFRLRTPQWSAGPLSGYESIPTGAVGPWLYAGYVLAAERTGQSLV